MKNKYEKAIEILEKYKQQHVIKFIDNSDVKTKNELIEQVLRIDFKELEELYQKTFEDLYVDLEEMNPIKGVNPDNLTKEELQDFENVGTKIIKGNKFAVCTMAGGQGTRLRASWTKRYI
ncbi:MAG: hypothetical protein IJB90_01440 [Clostridia bacterium]|nr:hypothetical protein [Clostridia bacterium]